MPTTTDYTLGQQPCQDLKRQRDGNCNGEWANVHCCYKCDLTVSYCENCNRDHHERGYESCKPNLPEIPDSSPLDADPAPDDPMDPEEVLRRAEAFDPLLVEPVGCPCPACTATKHMKREHAIMRLALQMIVAKSNPDEQLRLAGSICGGAISTLDHICKVAEQALRECGK